MTACDPYGPGGYATQRPAIALQAVAEVFCEEVSHISPQRRPQDLAKIGVISFVMFLPVRELLRMASLWIYSIRDVDTPLPNGEEFPPWGWEADETRAYLFSGNRPRRLWGLDDNTVFAASDGPVPKPVLDMTW